ncbi:hypothetical protein [Paenibacillus sp. RC67]|uniref:hypothetical protein n=1 Tax=Paenibacillus sp. RC67 TaxID=3039392 RepID=UPI0024AE2D7D|nr:hypothetical protein [Paenibacillus sp. RC67]
MVRRHWLNDYQKNLMNVPWYYLDTIVHHQTPTGRYKRTTEEQIEVLKDIDKNGEWISEGTDTKSYQCLYQTADTMLKMMYKWSRDFELDRSSFEAKLKIYSENPFGMSFGKERLEHYNFLACSEGTDQKAKFIL